MEGRISEENYTVMRFLHCWENCKKHKFKLYCNKLRVYIIISKVSTKKYINALSKIPMMKKLKARFLF